MTDSMKKLGFGTMRLPLLDENDQKSIDLKQFSEMADLFLDRGFTYFDTAYPYHEEQSEIAVRKCLVERHGRDKFLLADKMPLFQVNKTEDYERIFKEQLEKCGVEYFDYYLLHNLGADRYGKTLELGGFEFVERMKREGYIRQMGFSFHDSAELLERILTEHPEVDFVQLQINYLDWESPVAQSRLCYETATRHGKPVAVMEPVKGGTLAVLPERAMQVFAGTSPSYLVLQSLDLVNRALAADYPQRLAGTAEKLSHLRSRLEQNGWETAGQEPLKLTLRPKSRGFSGTELASLLAVEGIVCEFSDPDHLVMMFTPEIEDKAFAQLERVLFALPEREPLQEQPPLLFRPEAVLRPREALLAPSEEKPVSDCIGRVLAVPTVSCPPAVPILVCGERIDKRALALFDYYGAAHCRVVIE